jgi:PLP dependent protein
MDIENNLRTIQGTLPSNVKLIAVTKTKPEGLVMEAYRAGHKFFGENKAQELALKHENLPKDIEWHMIGHLQTNKIKYIIPFISLIHSIDSLNLLQAVDKEANKCNRIVLCLLQLKIAQEETKFGLTQLEIARILETKEFNEMKNIRIVGLMGMATYTEDHDLIRNEFRYCKSVFEELRTQFFSNQPDFKELSMGMSDDYRIAIEEGSTMVRIGSLVFGARSNS